MYREILCKIRNALLYAMRHHNWQPYMGMQYERYTMFLTCFEQQKCLKYFSDIFLIY